MPDPQDDDLDRSPLAVATRYSDRAADPGYDPNAPPEYRGQFLNQTLPGNPGGWGPSAQATPEQPYTGPFADQYEPGWRDAVADWLRSAIGERDKMMSPEGYRAVTGIAGATGAGSRGSSVADFVPGLGLATASLDSAQALHSGNYPIATLAALSALVPGGVGKFLSKAGRGAVRSVTDPVRELFGNPRPGMTQTGPVQARAVHGAPVGYDAFKLDRGTPHEDYWASDAPATANTYTHTDRAADPAYDHSNFHPNLTPVDLDFKNALIVNKGGGRHDYHGVPYETKFNGLDMGTTDYLAAYAKAQGHDGLVVHNVRDGLSYHDKAPYATTYAALQPGTVKSALSGAQIFGLAPAAIGAADMASQDRPSGFAAGGTPPYPGDDPDFLSMLANNSRGWGNAPPIPQSVAEQEPWNFPGEARNLPDRPSDPIETPLAESLSPTMGAYGMGDLLGESLNRFASGDLKGSAETALPLLLGIFAGPGARTADLGMLAKAKELASAKAPREQIWGDTGWFQGPDQKWKFEIPDNEASYAAKGYRGGAGKDAFLPDVLTHDQLYDAYPGMKDIQAGWRTGPGAGRDFDATGERGAYIPPEDGKPEWIIGQNETKQQLIPTLLHEVQHAVSQREGFQPGTSPTAMHLYRISAAREFDQSLLRLEQMRESLDQAHASGDGQAVAALEPQLQAATQETGRLASIAQTSPFDLYHQSASEVEARNVQNRFGMTPEQRRATPPWETQDVPDDQQIVRSPSSSGVQMSMKPKTPPYPGDSPVKNSTVSGNPLAASAGDRLSLRSNRVESGSAPDGFDPDVWYHGTNVPGLTKFDRRFLPEDEPGFAFTNNRELAQAYVAEAARHRGGEPTVYEAHLNPQRYEERDRQGEPWGPEVHDDLWNDFDSWNGQYGISGTVMRNMPDGTSSHANQMATGRTGEHVAYVYDPNTIHLRSPHPQSGSGEGTTSGSAGRLPDSKPGVPPFLGDVGAGSVPAPIRAYHGSPNPWDGPFDPAKAKASHQTQPRPYFADDPEEASGYAMARDQTLRDDAARGDATAPTVYPADIDIRNPFNGSMNGPDGYNYITPALYKKLVGVKSERGKPTGHDVIREMYVQEADKLLPPEVRATKGAEYDPNVKGYYGYIYDPEIAPKAWEGIYKRLEKAGYDGFVEPNTPADYSHGKYTKIIPFKRGTVKSATSKEPLFADGGRAKR